MRAVRTRRPTLKAKSASGMSPCGSPMSDSALAKPKPCSSPNVKATTHGQRAVSPISPRSRCTISTASSRMLSAIAASTGGPGTCTTPSVASASVIECATVNAVMVRAEHASAANDQDERQHEEQMIEAEEDVLDPVREIGAHHRERPARSRRSRPRAARAAPAWSSDVPSRSCTRTSTSVIVPCSPTNSTRFPASPLSPASSVRRSSERIASAPAPSAPRRRARRREASARPAGACRTGPACATGRRSGRAPSP